MAFETRFYHEKQGRTKTSDVVIDPPPPLSNPLGDVLIQVQQRGCCGVCSGRRHPQRKSSIFVVILLDSGPRTVSIRGHCGRRCESVRFEKVRTIELLSSYLPPPPPPPPPRPLNSFRSLHTSFFFIIEQTSLALHVLLFV